MNKEYLNKELVNRVIKKAALDILNHPEMNDKDIILKYFESREDMVSNQLSRDEFTCLVESKVITFNTDLIQ